jgi:addiction module HigA family antidote
LYSNGRKVILKKLGLSIIIINRTMKRLPNIHPGEALFEEFLKPLNISAYKLSKDIGIPQTRTSEILKGKRRITADTALRLSYYFGNSARFWLGLQVDYDIEEEKRNKIEELNQIKKINVNAA